MTQQENNKMPLGSVNNPTHQCLNRISNLLNANFNEVQLDNIKSVNEYYFDYFINTEWTKEDIMNNHGYSAKECNALSEDEIEDLKTDMMNEHNEIMWNTLFECRSESEADRIRKNADKIIKEAGVLILDLGQWLEQEGKDIYTTGLFIGFSGCGYDFYGQHWKPLFEILGLDSWNNDFENQITKRT